MPTFTSTPASEPLTIQRAYYIKLGRGGAWEEDCISHGKMRLGWGEVPLPLIREGCWDEIEAILRGQCKDRREATRAFNGLRTIAESGQDDVWVTFFGGKMWWCHLEPGDLDEDETSKFRKVKGKWRDTDLSGQTLYIAQIPGVLSKVTAFRWTTCSISDVACLERVINDIPSNEFIRVSSAKRELVAALAQAVRGLHWKDFETLVDLVFRAAGWRRVSVLGENMKFTDLELQEPVTGDRFLVQVKSASGRREFEDYVAESAAHSFRKMYYVVHSPSPDLVALPDSEAGDVELILADRLSELVVDAGLVGWVLDKIK